MKVQDIMTRSPKACLPDTRLVDVAKMMVECNCGAIPVVNDQVDHRPVGIITDRDIAVRAVAEGKDPAQTRVGDIMSKQDIATIRPEADVHECIKLMEDKQVRRVPVVDEQGKLTGMIVQAQIARYTGKEETAELLHEVSQPS